ncbi:cysteine synthase [Nannochloropsis gaditana]|uniref:Cysteine synthase n=1 Tax=Nannochloropsis gaditana TaxID=72520 RepID=W7TSS3_9STRA|nr:cysteine synthase [Nannochloropsis gaditana]
MYFFSSRGPGSRRVVEHVLKASACITAAAGVMALTTPYYSAENGKRGTPGSSFYFSSPCRGPARAQGHPAWVHSSEEEEERGTTNDDEKHRRFYRPPYNRSGDKGERGGGGGKRMGHGNLRHGMHSHTDEVVEGFAGTVGNTPLVEIKSLSRITGCRILAKAEHLNPSGSINDRAAVYMVEDAERKGRLRPGGVIVEGTRGNTGISLALASLAKGYQCVLVVPDSVSAVKVDLMRAYGAHVHVQPSVPLSDSRHFYHKAAALAQELREAQAAALQSFQAHHQGLRVEEEEEEEEEAEAEEEEAGVTGSKEGDRAGGVEGAGGRDESVEERREVPSEGWEEGPGPLRLRRHMPKIVHLDQYENLANFKAHFEGTGPEIWRQVGHKIDAFVSGAGTGGTLADDE